MIPVRYNPTGVLDKDTDVVYINAGNYTHAVNIRHSGDEQGRSVSTQNAPGTLSKFTLPGSGVSQKRYRLYIDLQNNASSYPTTLYIYDKNKQVVGENTGAFVPVTTTVQDYIDALWTYIGTSTAIYGTSSLTRDVVVDIDGRRGYMEIYATSLPRLSGANDLYGEWFLSFVDSVFVDVHVMSEAVSVDEDFSLVGSIFNGEEIWMALSTPSGRGQIGVAVRNKSDDTYAYTGLISSKKFQFDPEKRIDMQIEKNSMLTSLYFTDNVNPPRVMYYSGAFVADGFTSVNGGRYDLENLPEQITLFSSPGTANLTVEAVLQGGGALKAGNKRYTGRFISDSSVKTNCIQLTNPVPIYSADLAAKAFGDSPGTQTNKVVQLQLNDIPNNLFDYFELICVDYSGDAETAYVVKRIKLDKGISSITIKHGTGDDNTPVAVEEIQAIDSFYAKAKNIRIIETRLVLSNVETLIDSYDLSEWASSITHSLAEKDLVGCGLIGDMTDPDGDFQFGEYSDPINVSYYTGYMKNDTYRFGVEVMWKDTNKWSRSFWVDDIKFNTSATNVTSPNRRTANTLGNNLTDSSAVLVKVPYVNFSFDINYTLSDGSRLRDKVKAIRFVRAERIPEVLATGMGVIGTSAAGLDIYPYGAAFYTRRNASSTYGPYAAANYPNPHSYLWGGVAYLDNAHPAAHTAKDDYIFLFSPDLLLRAQSIAEGKTLQLLVYGVPTGDGYAGTTKNNDALSEFSQNSGYFNAAPNTYTVSAYGFLPKGSSKSVGGSTVNSAVRFAVASGKQAVYDDCMVIKTSASIVNPTAYTDTKLYYVQVRKDRGDDAKYPENKELTVYQQTGHLFVLSDAVAGIQTQSVFGGDVFTQQTYLKVRYGAGTPASVYGVGGEEVGYSAGCSFYSQNVANTQMRYVEADDTVYGWQFPIKYTTDVPGTTWDGLIGGGLLFWLDQPQQFYHQNNYQHGYDPKYNIQLNVGYDQNDNTFETRPTLIAWSDSKIYGSRVDAYRNFQPVNYVEMSLTDGPIEHMEEVNGSLFTWQHRAFSRHYFNTSGMLKSDDGQEILLGDTGVMSRGSDKISSFGTQHKWSVVKGVSKGGNDTLYWVDYLNNKVVRFGADGTYPISDMKFMRSFFDENMKFCSGEYDIHGAHNARFKEVVFTFRAISKSTSDDLNFFGDFAIPLIFNQGDKYYNPAAPITHASGLMSVFICKQSHAYSAGVTDPGTGTEWETYWDEYGPNDPEAEAYYNLYTISIDETRGGFSSFWSFWPKLYVRHNSDLLSADPLTANIHKHDVGPRGRFYGVDYDAEFESVINYDPNLVKWPEAIRVYSETVPYRVEFGTQNHESYLQNTDFELVEEMYSSTIKNDSSGTGSNSGDTSRLFGTWLKTKFIMAPGVFQKIRNYVVKFRDSQRDYRR